MYFKFEHISTFALEKLRKIDTIIVAVIFREDKMKKLKLALLGFGNAGQAFCRLLLEKSEEIKNNEISEISNLLIYLTLSLTVSPKQRKPKDISKTFSLANAFKSFV